MDELNDLSPLEKARALLERGRVARREGREELAHSFYMQSLNLCRGQRNWLGEAAALADLADLAIHYNPTDQNPFSRRKDLAEEALAIYRELDDKRGTARCLRLLSTVTPREEAIRLLEESLTLAREEGYKKGIAASFEMLGALHAVHEFEKGVAFQEESLALYREIDDREGETQVLFGLAVSYMVADPARSRYYGEAALALCRALGRKRIVARMLALLAGPHLDDETKIAYRTECREICREIGDPIGEASSLRDLAQIAEKRGELARARALSAEADQIFPETVIDPELLKEFEQALGEEDSDAVQGALRKLFGTGEGRRTTQ
jgi:tetratricopeptide (TPR) repeat protein